MTDREEGRRISRLIGGGLLALVGTLLVLQNFGLLRAGSLGDYWPMLLIWIGATRLLGPSRAEHRGSGAILLALGLFFQLDRFGWIGVSLADLWPGLLVAAGLAMILEGLRGRRPRSASSAGAADPGVQP